MKVFLILNPILQHYKIKTFSFYKKNNVNNVEQVWTPGTETEESQLYKQKALEEQEVEVEEEVALEHYLPISTAVWVDHRHIPASPQSSLKFQATIVMKVDEESEDGDNSDDDPTMPDQYTDMISSFEDRVAFVEELDDLHDLFKTIKYTGGVHFKRGLEYRERMSRLAEEGEDDEWDDEELDEDEEEEEEIKDVKHLLHPVPEHVGTVSPDVQFYDETRMCLRDRELQSVISNCIGMVDQVLTDHLAILSFQQGAKKIKVLCSSEDTFLLDITESFQQLKDFKANNELRFDDAQEVWRLSARHQQKSLFSVLRADQEIVFNAVALVSNPDTNLADINYVTAGVAVPSTPQTSVSVPVAALSSGHKLTEDFKKFFTKIIGSSDTDGQFEEEDTLPVDHPQKFPDIYYEGRKGKMNLRPEYTPADVLMTKAPAMNKSRKVKGNLLQEKNMEEYEEKIPIEDLKSKDQRSLIQSYIDMVTQISAASSPEHLDMVKLQGSTKIDKPLEFFEDLCLALYRKCLNVKKGFKVGQIFVTQVQVNLILKHGGVFARGERNNNCKSKKYNANQG